jgi:hypothetical protein
MKQFCDADDVVIKYYFYDIFAQQHIFCSRVCCDAIIRVTIVQMSYALLNRNILKPRRIASICWW